MKGSPVGARTSSRRGILRHLLAAAAAVFPALLPAAELVLDFGTLTPGAPPATFKPSLTGNGPAPEWKVIQTDAPSALPAFPDRPPETTRETVIAQLSKDPADERFPLLVYQPEEFADFTAKLKFRTVSGRVEQMAGLAFRLSDERNYYVIRASSLGNSLRFYKFVDGVRSDPIGPEMKIPAGAWHELEVSCKGNSIQCRLDGRDGIPTLTDTSFGRGRIALWTKSDSVSHFASLRLTYDMLKALPQRLVESAMEKHPKLMGVTVYAGKGADTAVVASSDASEVGKKGTGAEAKALSEGLIQAGTLRGVSTAVFPLRDRNGDPLFAVRLRMKSFVGQTDSNVASRAKPIADELEEIVRVAEQSNENDVIVRAPQKN